MRFFAFALSFFLMLAVQPAMSGSVLLPDEGANDTAPANLGILPTLSPTATIPSTVLGGVNAAPRQQTPSVLTNEQIALLDRLRIKFRNPNDAEEIKSILRQLTPEQRKLFDSISPNAITANAPITLAPGGVVASQTATKEQNAFKEVFGSGVMPQSQPPSKMRAFAEKARKEIEAQEKKVARPPVFLDEIKPTVLDDSAYQSVMLVQVLPTYLWGVEDIRLLERSLGYDARTIPQNCQIRIDATLKTTDAQAPYTDQIFSGSKKQIKYNGDFQYASFRARAFCRPPQELPPNAGVITRSGQQYSILLGKEESLCKSPSSNTVGALLVNYAGDGKISCQFQ